MIFDEQGNLVNKRAFKTIKIIEDEVDQLYRSLLKQGMTIVEGRALADSLQGAVSVSTVINLMKAQCK